MSVPAQAIRWAEVDGGSLYGQFVSSLSYPLVYS